MSSSQPNAAPTAAPSASSVNPPALADRGEALTPLQEEALLSAAPQLNSSGSFEKGKGKEAEMKDAAEPFPPPPEHNLDKALKALHGSRVADITSAPLLRLASIRIEGAKDVRPNFLLSVCRPYVDPFASNLPWANILYGYRTSAFIRPGQQATLGGILQLTQSIGADLSAFDLFKDVSAKLVPSANPLADPVEDVDIVIECVKKSRVFLKSSTDIGNGEGTASVQGRFRNIFGGAETLEGSATFGTRTKQALNLLFTSPMLASPVLTGSLAAFTSDRDISAWSSSFELTRGLRAALLYTGRPFQQHEIACEASWRHLGRLLPDASIAMRKLGGDSVKAALTHTWIQDTRDDPFMASRGFYFKAVQELAGLGGDTNFVKVEGEMQSSRRLPHGWAWSFASRLGLLRTLDGRSSFYSDRFQLGGPSCVRMFRQSSLGPKDGFDSLGGDAFWSAGLSLIAPMPKREQWPIKLHGFLNAGQLCQLNQKQPLMASASSLSNLAYKKNLRELMEPSVSAGFGLVYTQGPLRAELNAGVPLVARRGDGGRKGVQFGIGVSFL